MTARPYLSRLPRTVPAQALFRLAGLFACLAIFLGDLAHAGLAEYESTELVMVSQELSRALALLLGIAPEHITRMAATAPGLYAGIFLVFAAAFLLATRRQPGRYAAFLIAAQVVIGLLISDDLLLIVAAELPFVFPLRTALWWLLGQSLALAALFGHGTWRGMQHLQANAAAAPNAPAGMADALLLAIGTGFGLYLAWQAFAFCLGTIAMAERRSRISLAATHAELLATQQLLADSARDSERLRIAGELHDGLGHHLTALGLHLELARRQPTERVAQTLETAQQITGELLREVRQAVGRERAEAPPLQRSLETLCKGLPQPSVDLRWDARASLEQTASAHAAFRAVQEALSNAARHAQATQVEVHVRDCTREGMAGIAIEVRDDGAGCTRIKEGSGLAGMRERLAALGGQLQIVSAPGAGFALSIWLPLAPGAAA